MITKREIYNAKEDSCYCPYDESHKFKFALKDEDNRANFKKHLMSCKFKKSKNVYLCKYYFFHMFHTSAERDNHQKVCIYLGSNSNDNMLSEIDLSDEKAIDRNGSKIIEEIPEIRIEPTENLKKNTKAQLLPQSEDFITVRLDFSQDTKTIHYEVIFIPRNIEKILYNKKIELLKKKKIDEIPWLQGFNMQKYKEFIVLEMERMRIKSPNNERITESVIQKIIEIINTKDEILYSDIAKNQTNEILVIVNKNTKYIGQFIQEVCFYAILVVPYSLMFDKVQTGETRGPYWISSNFSHQIELSIKAEMQNNPRENFSLELIQTQNKEDMRKKMIETKNAKLELLQKEIEKAQKEIKDLEEENFMLSEQIQCRKKEKVSKETTKNKKVEEMRKRIIERKYNENYIILEDELTTLASEVKHLEDEKNEYIEHQSKLIAAHKEKDEHRILTLEKGLTLKKDRTDSKILLLQTEIKAQKKAITDLKNSIDKETDTLKQLTKKRDKYVTKTLALEKTYSVPNKNNKEGKQICIVCRSNFTNLVLLDCRHLSVFCSFCHYARNITDCPLCKQGIRKTVEINLAISFK